MPPERSSTPKVDRKKKFYLLHGDDEAAIENFKHAIVGAHLSLEEREENYREIIPSGSPPSLRKVLGEVVSELSTVSFLPGVSRVVTLYPVSDFFEARAIRTRAAAKRAAKEAEDAAHQKRTPSEHLAQFIGNDLSSLPAVLIIIVVEDYEKWKRVNAKNPVVELAQRLGTAVNFREQGPQFAFFDALFARQSLEAVRLWREWVRRAAGSPKPFFSLATQLRLLIQAKTAASSQLQTRGISREQYGSEFLPEERDRNVFALTPDWRREKLMRLSGNFSFAELLGAYEQLNPILKATIPLNSDPFVADKQLLSELWIAQYFSRREA